MASSTFVLLCVVLTCSVWTVQGKCVAIDDGLQEGKEGKAEVETAVKLPGICWVCKWALNKVKKAAGKNATVEKLKSQLLKVCDKIGFLKSRCKKFVDGHLGDLIEELSTTDDVRTICVNVKACKPKEATMDLYYSLDTAEVFGGRYVED